MRWNEIFTERAPQGVETLKRVDNPEDPEFNVLIPDEIKYDEDVWDYVEGDTAFCSQEEKTSIRQLLAAIPYVKKMVPHSKMSTGQRYVTAEGVEKYLRSPSGDLPTIDELHGHFAIMNGHHRIVADILKGKTATLCEVRTLDEYIDDEGYIKGANWELDDGF